MARELTEAQKQLLADQDAAGRLRYVEEHSGTRAELDNARETLQEMGINPDTGRPQ